MNAHHTKHPDKRVKLHQMLLGVLPLALISAAPAHGQAPSNDECDTANVILSSAPPDAYTDTVDATDATLNPADPLLSCNAAGDDDGTQTVWWEYTPDASGWVNINTSGSLRADGDVLDTAHGAFTGSCAALTEVACVDVGLTDNLNFEVEAGETYYIKVGQFLGGSDAGTVTVNVEEGVPPRQPAKLIIESLSLIHI